MFIKCVLMMAKILGFFSVECILFTCMLIYQIDNFLWEITTEEPGLDFDSEEVRYNSL